MSGDPNQDGVVQRRGLEAQSSASLPPAIHAFGDSHVVACFGRILEVEIHHLGAQTMHRVGRDGAARMVAEAGAKPGDVLIFIFGEIDVRAHLTRPFNSGKRKKSAQEIALAYVSALQLLKEAGFSIVVCALVPPADNRRARSRAVPVYGSAAERAALTREINQRLAAADGLLFLDFYADFADPMGVLRPELSDGHVHVAAEHTEPVWAKLCELLCVRLTLLDTPKVSLGAHVRPAFYKQAAKSTIHAIRRLWR